MSEVEKGRRGMRILGAVLVASGLGVFALTAVMVGNDTAQLREDVAQQSFVEGQCSVVRADVSQRYIREDNRPTVMTVTMVVHAGHDVANVRYVYPDYWWNPVSAAAAVATTHAPGAHLPCYFDPADPLHAVLVRRAAPPGGADPVHAADGGSPWIPGGIVGCAFLLFGVMALIIKPDPNRRRRDD